MNKFIPVGLGLLMLGTQAYAETIFIKERQVASLRAGPAAEDDVVARAVTGTGLEVIEKTDVYTKVRTADGTEGWIANTMLTQEKPAAMRVLSAETRMKQARAETKKLQQEVKALKVRLTSQQSDQTELVEPKADIASSDSSFLNIGFLAWIGISFAMLITGFVVGVAWLRERTRRKLGGMHIRVS